MRLRTGTSGFSYKAWKGAFYPADLADRDMLEWYARRLGAVEVNQTFYRMPKADVLERWRSQVPEDFVFVVKASQRITHRARLKDADDAVGHLWRTLQALGPNLGPVLFQLPPNFRRDLERLGAFLAALPAGLRAALEFRHPSWSGPETLEVLAEHGAALCTSDTEDLAETAAPSDARPELPATADWGYVRLRREHYGEADLAAWAARLQSAPWREAFVFFKHDGDGAWSARRAARLAEISGGGTAGR